MPEPVSYLTLPEGASVFSSDGERVGAVQRVLADESTAIFDGVVIDIRLGPGGLRFVDAPQVLSMDTRGLTIDVPAAEVDALPRPEGNPAVMRHTGIESIDKGPSKPLRTLAAFFRRR